MSTEPEMRRIIIEAPSGERFEADVPCDTKLSQLAVDFFEDRDWPTEQHGQRQRAVVELVNPLNPSETKRLNGDNNLCDENIEDGDTLRIFTEATAHEVVETDLPIVQRVERLAEELAAQRQAFEGRIGALEKRLNETAESLGHLTQTLQQMESSDASVEQAVATLATSFDTLTHTLQNPTITFRSVPVDDKEQLYTILRDYFNKSELQDLCFGLAIPYEDLRGETQTDKVRELITYAQRHGQTPALIEEVLRRRPHLREKGQLL